MISLCRCSVDKYAEKAMVDVEGRDAFTTRLCVDGRGSSGAERLL